MLEPSSDRRFSSGFPETSPPPRTPVPGAGQGGSGAIAVELIVRAVHRHRLLFLLLSTLTALAVIVVLRSPDLYRATAVLRLTGDRRVVASGMETTAPSLDRNSAPLLSLVPILRSRTLVGMVVDSLSLQLQPVSLSPWSAARGPTAQALGMDHVRIDPGVPGDTLRLRFEWDRLFVMRAGSWVQQPYGTPLSVRGVNFTIPKQPKVVQAALGVLNRDLAIDKALEQLAVVPVTGTDAVEIKFTDEDPAVAQQAVNLLLQTFQASTIRGSQEQARRRRLFLADQLQETDRLLDQAQANLSAFRSRQRLASSSDELAMRQAALMTLDTRRGEMEANRLVYQGLLGQLETRDDSARVEGLRMLVYSPEIATDPVVGRLYQQLLVYRTRLDSLTTGPWRASSTNPDVIQLNQLLNTSQQELIRAVRAHLRSLDQRTAAMATMRNSQSSQLQSLPALEAEETRLAQQVGALSTLADQLRLERQKARMSEELAASDIDIVDLASRPYRPVGVPWWLKVGLGLFFGLAAGAGAAVLLEIRNRSMRAPEEVRRVIPVPGLGVIPHVIEAGSPRGFAGLRQRLAIGPGTPDRSDELVKETLSSPSVGAEAFRLLYSSLLLTWRQGSRTILVTSSAPQEGKTFVASNLAVTFAREGARVLLVDCDLRRPRVHRVFGLSRSPGLVELLTKQAVVREEPTNGFPAAGSAHRYSMAPETERQAESGPRDGEDAGEILEAPQALPSDGGASAAGSPWIGTTSTSIRSTSVSGLFVLPCGALPRHPGQVLRAGVVRSLLMELSRQFDVIILDTPPVLVSADAPILAPIADDVLMVVRAGQTNREAAERAYEQLAAAGASFVGAILNDPAGELVRHQKLYSYDYPAVTD